MDESSIVGVGLQQSRDDHRLNMGHMWLRWYDEDEGRFQYRGYYPVMEDLPDTHPSELREHLCFEVVRGCYKDDIEARIIEEEIDKNSYLVKCWDFSVEQHDKVLQYCRLPEGRSYVISGHYSCNEKITYADNCSSWTIKTLVKAKDDDGFITCDRPKRLKHVERAIWG
ncbi:MAG: hypothetical protein SFH39_17955 [Candidatus Magnetobacterium sp. LHC-1]|nr:hypothetical protein [Nitrospirota bacterium]